MRIATTQMARRVWADCTRYPNSSQRERAQRLFMAWSYVSDHMHHLRDLGYIEYADRKSRTVQVLVPFVQVPSIVYRDCAQTAIE